MTDIVQAREAAIRAETAVEQMLEGVMDRLHQHNGALARLHDAIKANQPVATGAVCLELYACGRGCAGCPHPRWVQYNWAQRAKDKPAVLRAINLDAQNRDPILTLKRKDPHYPVIAELIREAKSILAERSLLLARLKALHPFSKQSTDKS